MLQQSRVPVFAGIHRLEADATNCKTKRPHGFHRAAPSALMIRRDLSDRSDEKSLD
jgi:hypothetical protein